MAPIEKLAQESKAAEEAKQKAAEEFELDITNAVN